MYPMQGLESTAQVVIRPVALSVTVMMSCKLQAGLKRGRVEGSPLGVLTVGFHGL